jgi:hypothetical protein
MNGDEDMTPLRVDDASLDSLRRLENLSPDPARAEHVRARCSAQLSLNRQSAARATLRTGIVRHVLAPVVVFGFCVLYIASLVTITLRMHGLIQ